MENFNDIVTTIQLTLLVLAIPAVKVLLAWRDLLEAKAYREEEAGSKDYALSVVAMVNGGIIKTTDAKAMLVDDEDGNE